MLVYIIIYFKQLGQTVLPRFTYDGCIMSSTSNKANVLLSPCKDKTETKEEEQLSCRIVLLISMRYIRR